MSDDEADVSVDDFSGDEGSDRVTAGQCGAENLGRRHLTVVESIDLVA